MSLTGSPSDKPVEDDIPQTIYSQQHALECFEERAVFLRGIVQAYIGYVIRENIAKIIIKKDYVLLEYYLDANKVG
ncbi:MULTISPECIES: hypothetical protein [Sphingobacterium]|uniref:hypothetical protein n=1 Tax=Sphingobacterium TaxID=28453 RepID=UPI00257E5146|nr:MULTISPECIES: hypothetical protein [Sphingobacterium]